MKEGTMKRKTQLLIIDPQNDFCDLPTSYLPENPATRAAHAPALPVPGAHQDMLRLAGLINRGRNGISAITVTLDSHHRYDVAHPTERQSVVAPWSIRPSAGLALAFCPRLATF